MDTTDPQRTDAEELAALRAAARAASHDAKNAIGIVWLHLAMLDRKLNESATPETREALDGVKEETRQLVRMMDELSAQARRGSPAQ